MPSKEEMRVAEQGKQPQTPRVVRVGKRSSRKRKKRPLPKWLRAIRKIFSSIFKLILTVILILTITGCIVGTAMTIYVMQYVDSGAQISLQNLKMSYTSVIFGKDAEGNDVEVQRMHREENRIWVDYDDIPDVVKAAFVLAEDERFFEHEGVDFLRTGSAVINYLRVTLLHQGDNIFGGSTITQQLIKNINGDVNDRSIANKIKEIMQSMNMERNYTKPQILEAYLNYAAIGPNINGVQAASQYYFGKDVSELNANEAVALAVAVKNPSKLNPGYRVNNTSDTNYEQYMDQWDDRHYFILGQLLENGKLEGSDVDGSITQAEYDRYIDEYPEVVTSSSSGSGGAQASSSGGYSYYVDAVIEQVIDDLQAQYGWTASEAEDRLLTGGYRVYTPMDIEMQNKLEELFVNPETFAYNGIADELIPDAAMVLISMQEGEEGYVSALVGGRGEKTVARGFNLATDAVRSFGSTIKPLSVYAPAFRQNLITWSDIFQDEPKMYKDENGQVVLAPATWDSEDPMPEDFHLANWPNNYNMVFDGPITIIDALKVSKNTVPVEIYNLMESIEPMSSYNFLTKNFHFPDLVGGDLSRVGQDSMVLGSAGTTLLDLTGAFQVFGNGGEYTQPILYTQVLDAEGKVILDNTGRRTTKVLDSDTAYIMNRALWEVVNGTAGVGGSPSGGAARLNNGIEVVGKTGTSMDRKDLVFMGVTPYYVAGIRYGHSDNSDIANEVGNSHVQVWNRVMTELLAGKEPANFDDLSTDGVVKETYCLDSGKLAGDLCTRTATGYYKANFMPVTCTSHGDATAETETEEGTEEGTDPESTDEWEPEE